MQVSNPQISIVIAVRNDNYGGDFTERLQTSLDWNTRWLEHYCISSEIVLVNWNPVIDKTGLEESIHWPKDRKYVSYRVVDVPAEVHVKYVDETVRKTVPLFEFIAKNAGIRRAQGKFILCTNADILIHPNILSELGNGRMDKSRYYRANRLDFKKTTVNQVSDMWETGFAISLKGFMYQIRGSAKPLQVALLKRFNKLRLGYEMFKYRNSGFANKLGLNVVYNNGAYLAHCLNSGDFMLMHYDLWMQMKAYPEYTQISTHTDAIFSVLARQRYPEIVLNEPVFHQEHQRRYTWEAIKQDHLFNAAYRLFEDIANEVKQDNNTDRFLNTDDWGLASENLTEKRI